jgi:hypothetical protein
MGIRVKLVGLGVSALLLVAGVAGPFYPWVMEIVGDPDGSTATALAEIRSHLWGPPAEPTEELPIRFHWSKFVQLLAAGAVIGAVSVRMMGRSKATPSAA